MDGRMEYNMAYNIEQNDDSVTVDIPGMGSVVINHNDDGISVDIYPLWVADEPAASCYALMSDLIHPDLI